MLARVDRALAWLSWLLAAAAALMLFVGPHVVARDQARGSKGASPYTVKPGGVDGRRLFAANCGSCHTLSAAGTSGQSGPNLDHLSLTAAQVATKVRQGGGIMPSFDGTLTSAEISAVAAFVAGAH